MMFVYSGECRLCECGLKTTLKDFDGEELKTGDIVINYNRDKDGLLRFMSGLSVVVCNQWQSYSGETHKLINEYPDGIANDAFVMGIKDAVLGEEWQAELVKRHEDVVSGEHWQKFGFSFREH